MMLNSSLPYLDGTCSTHSVGRWPVARCQLSWTRGRLIPTVRCVLVHSDQYASRLSSVSGAAAAAGPKWEGHPLWTRTKTIALALADTHKAWSTQSLQTLQRVGSIIRSTSIDCLAALGKKGTAAGQQPEQPPGDDDDQDEDSLVRANLSRFLSTADDAEVSQAARMSDLSNMAYDVLDVTAHRLQETHGLTLITHSRSSTAPQQAQLPEHRKHDELLQQAGAEAQHTQQLPAAPAPWPVPLVLLQAAGNSSGPSTDYSGTPASSRAPAVLASYAEDDYALAGAGMPEFQAVTASGYVTDPGSPRRPSAAAAAAAGGGVAVAPMGMPAATAMGDLPPAYMQPALMRQHSSDYAPQYDYHYDQQQDEQLSADEIALLQQLKQQEAFILLEMQASQQMLLLLQQSQQQLHLQHSGDAPSAQDMQDMQLAVSAAASTAAAAALAGSSMGDSYTPGSPRISMSSAAAAAAAAAAGAGAASPDEAAVCVPADWFCCDGPMSDTDPTPTRFISIQGSITLDHWRINLTIDPCEFEGGALGPIRVHRGMYEAALAMYDTVLPLVQQHLAAHPEGKVALTGHSLGGSLATLLMLLMVHRGDLPTANAATVYTFGAPAVFCEGANGAPPSPGACKSCSLPCEHRKAHSAAGPSSSSSATDSLLSKLDLPADAVVNVIMTRDIVPRAFVCDYTLVAGVLKSWLPSFKEHKGLAACKEHKALYNFVGVVEVLQPTMDCDFVLPDEGHDMLPPGAALYKLTEPQQRQQQQQESDSTSDSSGDGRASRRGSFNSLSSLTNISSMSLSSALAELTTSFSLGGSSSSNGTAAEQHGDADSSSLGMVAVPVSPAAAAAEAAAAEAADSAVSAFVAHVAAVEAAEHSLSPAGAAYVMAAANSSNSSGSSTSSSVAKSSDGLTLGDAILTFMNSPHPLQTLGEMRAYGHNGSISRYHNPQSYTTALQKLSRS